MAPEPVETEEPEPEVIDEVNGPWVQDFWLYERIITIDSDGNEIDLTEDIVAGLGEPTESFELPFEGVFYTFDSLKPSITTGDGATRQDVDVIAGLLEFEGARALAALATPHPDATTPIGLSDLVELDVSFLDDKLQPGDPLIVDFAFLQARPNQGEASASGLELLADRLSQGSGYYLGDEVDGEIEVYAYQKVLATAVSGSTRLQASAKGPISDPALDGMREGWLKCLGKSPFKCVNGYFKSAGKGASKSNDLLNCNLGPCGDPDPKSDPEPKPEPSPQPTTDPKPDPKNERPWCTFGCTIDPNPPATVRGDPHIQSFDGLGSAMQGVGEYVLTTGSALDVHIRTAPINESSRTVSSVSMVGVRLGGQEIAVDAASGYIRIFIAGEEVPYDVTESLVTEIELDGITLYVEPRSVIVSSPEDQIGVVLTNSFSKWLDVSLYVPQDYSGLSGLLGNHDGESENDLQARDGTVLEPDDDETTYYSVFADSWRVDQNESLLHYETGESTDSFTHRNFPDLRAPAPTEAALMRAEAVCRAAGVTDPELLPQCAFDYASSGEIGFVRSAQAQVNIAERMLHVVGLAGSGSAQEIDGGVIMTDASVDSWSFTPGQFPEGSVLLHTCVPDGSFHTIWGGENGIYTDDSSVCTAAVHSGIITVEEGGQLLVTTIPGLDSYGDGSESNGVTSRSWGSWPGSFILEKS